MVGPLRVVLRLMHSGPFEGSFSHVMHSRPFEGSFLRVMHSGPLREVLCLMHGTDDRQFFMSTLKWLKKPRNSQGGQIPPCLSLWAPYITKY